MRQVPHYLIIGNGRVASHFIHYFSLLQISHSNWHVRLQGSLNHELNKATHVLVLISDNAIEPFIAEHLSSEKHYKLIHFSGSVVTDLAYGAHPLMTFSSNLYDIDKYQVIPFVIDHDAPSFEELFPGLPNPHVRLHKSLKPKYHAWCVLSGNFSCLLWQRFFNVLESEFNIPHAFATSYLKQQTTNLLNQPETALTGPLIRRDKNTIEKNIEALENDEFQEIYKTFIECYQRMNSDIKRGEQ